MGPVHGVNKGTHSTGIIKPIDACVDQILLFPGHLLHAEYIVPAPTPPQLPAIYQSVAPLNILRAQKFLTPTYCCSAMCDTD